MSSRCHGDGEEVNESTEAQTTLDARRQIRRDRTRRSTRVGTRVALVAVLVAALAATIESVATEPRAAATVVGTGIEPSTVRYRASHRFERWSGTLTPHRIDVTLDPSDLTTLTGTIVVRPAEFDSGNPLRDANARRVTFSSGTFETAVFTVAATSARDPSLPPGEVRDVEVAGTLLLHGVEQPIVLPLRLDRGGSVVGERPDLVSVTGSVTLSLERFGMRAPVLLGVTVDDTVEVDVNVTVSLTPGGSPARDGPSADPSVAAP